MDKSSHATDMFMDRLRAAREARRISQVELAERTGLQSSAISHFETGTRKPSFDNLRRVADALRVTTDYLLGRAAEMESSASTADVLHRRYAGLSADDQEITDEFVQMLVAKANKRKNQGG